MSKINDGGPAFPFEYEMSVGLGRVPHTGMSLRDWFAGQALAGMLDFSECTSYDISGNASADIARTAYRIADALLQSREATNG
jgi:hypothetical protein